MKKVIAVVVTFKRKSLLEDVIKGLAEQSYPLSEIIIIDNHSCDGTDILVDNLRKVYATSKISYYDTGDNLGGAGGFAYGFEVAQKSDFEYLWLMDDDLLPESDCLENHLATGCDGIIQPIRFNKDGSCAEISPIEYDLDSVFIINPKKKTVKDIIELKNVDIPVPIAGVPFEGPLISKSVVDKIGKPESKFFIFNDDLDYSIRARNAGFKILCQPKATAIRLLVNNQSNDLKSWKGYFMLRNHFYILRTHGKNFFVKSRPIILTLGYAALSIFRGDLDVALKVCRAYRDSYYLSNNDRFKP
ncbi:glycosyltransferase [Escherichia coli]|uniref:glycosyltransferase n=1 Tax=Escherichia coli TaxID=562 RepID=UPI00092D7F51|nr:glycosyltransferase [Escherichia coli]APK39654.1 glycosyl transferase 2 family protein [Escherichia coli]